MSRRKGDHHIPVGRLGFMENGRNEDEGE